MVGKRMKLYTTNNNLKYGLKAGFHNYERRNVTNSWSLQPSSPLAFVRSVKPLTNGKKYKTYPRIHNQVYDIRINPHNLNKTYPGK